MAVSEEPRALHLSCAIVVATARGGQSDDERCGGRPYAARRNSSYLAHETCRLKTTKRRLVGWKLALDEANQLLACHGNGSLVLPRQQGSLAVTLNSMANPGWKRHSARQLAWRSRFRSRTVIFRSRGGKSSAAPCHLPTNMRASFVIAAISLSK